MHLQRDQVLRPRMSAGQVRALLRSAGDWGSLRRKFPFPGSGIGSPLGRNLAAPLNKLPLSRVLNIAAGVGEGPVAMRTIVQLDRTMQLPLNLATGLRTIFRDAGSSPVPEQLAALVRQLGSDSAESSEDEHK
jgi:hypothetical protein